MIELEGVYNMTDAPASAPQDDQSKDKAQQPKEAKVTRARIEKFPDDLIITVLKENAKSRTANDRFRMYHTGMTVKQYVEALAAEPFKRTEAQTQADMRWDSNEDHRFINIGPEVVPIPPPPPPKEATADPQPEKKKKKKKLVVVEDTADQPAA